MSDLLPEHADALAQLQAITNSEDTEGNRAILESVGWDVQRAVQAIFDMPEHPDPPNTRDSQTEPLLPPVPESAEVHKMEQMEIDDSGDTSDGPLIPRHGTGYTFFSIVTFPISLSFSLLSNIVQFVFRLLRIPVPRFTLNGFTFRAAGGPGGLGLRRPTRRLDPVAAAERWIRELEDETGAMCVAKASTVAREEGRSSNGVEIGSSTASKAADSSTGTSSSVELPRHLQNTPQEGRGRLLPDFFVGRYDDALRLAQNEARLLCVVLVSDEHDDCLEFKRTVLTDPDFVRVLTDNNFIVWGGDVHDTEAYQAALKLNATTYPFVSFLSLHPRNTSRPGSSANNVPKLTVLSRYEGPPSSATSAQNLVTYMTSTLIPRVTPLLTRIRNEKRAQELQKERQRRAMEVERQLRAEQDRAFLETERLDKERIERRIREEKEKELALQREREEAERRTILAQKREDWRRWAKAHLVPAEPAPGTKGALRIGVRLPDGRRVLRLFTPTDSLEVLYAFVDTHFLKAAEDGDLPAAPPSEYTHQFGFNLATSFPRKEMPFKSGVVLGELEELLRGGGNLIMEMKPGFANDDDEEESESDEDA